MRKKTKQPKKSAPLDTVFFAYQGNRVNQCNDNAEAIRRGIKTFNEHQKTFRAKTWEDCNKTAVINVQVLEAIENCKVFACDLTFFNHNVIFEMGYAIGKGKDVIIFLNESIEGAGDKYQSSFLKAYTYVPFTNGASIATALQQHHFSDHISKELFKQTDQEECDIFYIKSSVATEASLELSEQIESLQLEGISNLTDDTAESFYKPNQWYAKNILKARSILIHFLGANNINANDENAWRSFWAGFAVSLGKHVLIAAPKKYSAPLDYESITIEYESSEDLITKATTLLRGWLPPAIPPVTEEIIIQDISQENEYDLLKLAIGEGIAEQERDHISDYFIETSELNAALTREKVIIVGRKGAGKTALYLKLLEEFSADKNNYVITLKPEAHELLEDIEMAKLFPSLAAKRSFFSSVWKMVIFSKLLLSISDHLQQRGNSISCDIDMKILTFISNHKEQLDMNVYRVMCDLSSRSSTSLKAGSLETVYADYLTPLCSLLKKYFEQETTKYHKVVILADNLDKTWNTTYDLDIQAELILSLLDMEGIIRKNLQPNTKTHVRIREIFFLRADIFDFIKKRHPDPDKLSINMLEIDWSQKEALLKKMVEKRFAIVLGSNSEFDAEKVWNDYFSLDSKQHPFKAIMQAIIPRPRDLIVFVTRLFESAYNNDRAQVLPADFEIVLEGYSTVLNENLIAETKAQFPTVEVILKDLQKHQGQPISYKAFVYTLQKHGLIDELQNEFIKTLFDKDYLLGYQHNSKKLILNYDALTDALTSNKWWQVGPLRPQVSMISHAKAYLIKNRRKAYF